MAKNTFSLASSLPKFNGEKDENLEFFLNNLEQISEIEKWDDKKKCLILKLSLSGNALKVVSDANVSEDNEYAELIKLLTSKFSLKKSYAEIQNRFNGLLQKPNQDIKSLIEEVEKVTNDYLEIDKNSNEQTLKLAEKMKSQKLLDSMRPDIRVEVMKRGETKFEIIGKIALDVENALSISDNHVLNLTKSSEIELLLKNQIESNKRIETLTQKVAELSEIKSLNNITQTYPSNVQKITCHICGKNHLTTDCWHFPENSNNVGNQNQRYNPYERNYRGNNFRKKFGRGSRGNFRRTNRRQNHLN